MRRILNESQAYPIHYAPSEELARLLPVNEQSVPDLNQLWDEALKQTAEGKAVTMVIDAYVEPKKLTELLSISPLLARGSIGLILTMQDCQVLAPRYACSSTMPARSARRTSTRGASSG